MARPRSDDRRSAIISAAIRVIALQGLSAPTASIAKKAGVSNGSLFTYFDTKAALLNELYVDLKTEMALAALDGIGLETDTRSQMAHMWFQWVRWATANPEKRRTLAHLGVSDDITPESHQASSSGFAGIAKVLERSRENGPLRDAPLSFVSSLLNALADATIDFMIHDPANADKHAEAAFDAMWRMIA